MEPFTFQVTLSDEQKRETAELIQSLKNDPFVIEMCQKNDITLQAIERYPWKIKKWTDGLKKCYQCKGLHECAHQVRGYVDHLVDDGIMHFVQKACKYEMANIEATKHLEKYVVNDLPKKLQTVEFSTIDLSQENTKYSNFVSEIMLEDIPNQNSIYLYGQMGSGKTFLSACAANYYAKQNKKVAFVSYADFCRRMSQLVQSGEYQLEVDRLKYADFVVFDDIGAESVTEWNRDQILFPILNARYENGLTTWFTSNYDIEKLMEHFTFSNKNKEETMKAARIIERITSMCKMKSLTGKDRRNNAFNQ